MHLEKKIDRKGQEAMVRTSGEGLVRLLSPPVREFQSPRGPVLKGLTSSLSRSAEGESYVQRGLVSNRAVSL